MIYSVYEFFTTDEIERGWLISLLSDYGFEGFEETNESLKAYASGKQADEPLVKKILTDNDFKHIEYTASKLENKNWNEEWEKNFEPVVVNNRVAIRAPFHSQFHTEFEIIIEPKMSFGTGHHATTASVIELMLRENFVNKTVLDFGSGTGVLAILAEKLKADSIVAIDNEEWAYKNCLENIERNHCIKITAISGDDSYLFNSKFDIILANINRNVILQNISKWKELLNKNGILIVSGILLSDEVDITNLAQNIGLSLKSKLKNNGWLAITFQHP